YKVGFDAPIVSPAAIHNLVYVVDLNGTVHALSPDDGTSVWTTDLPGPSWVPPTVGNGRVIVGNSSGRLTALDSRTGRVLWTYETGAVIRSPALIVGGYIVIGDQSGTLALLRADDGNELATVELDGAVKYQPVTDGSHVYVATQKGTIYCFGADNAGAGNDSVAASNDTNPAPMMNANSGRSGHAGGRSKDETGGTVHGSTDRPTQRSQVADEPEVKPATDERGNQGISPRNRS
ncbi:PQQ-binding-like beta-propeller repeat protein, partial [candidate division GN15 bacterium]|nr:PQQ-binding-like beta-propeller repeat protein [candidate division GN15 bacterium]